MNQWIEYNKETRKQIAHASSLAVKYSSGLTKTITERDSMKHYVKFDCSTLIKEFKIL